MTGAQVEKLLPSRAMMIVFQEGGVFSKFYRLDTKWATSVMFFNANKKVARTPNVFEWKKPFRSAAARR